jgi:hypothetical protein
MKSYSINKLTVAPQIVVYKNLLSNASEILDVFKESQADTTGNSFFKEWDEWSPNYNTPGEILKVRVVDVSLDINESDSDTVKKQKQVVSDIYEAFNLAKEDFLKDWAGKGTWPNIIMDWSTSDRKIWDNHEIDVLSYSSIPDPSIVHDPKDGVYNLPMNYHVDANPTDLHSQGTKLAITITMYLNDDYEGGEISFYNCDDDQMYNYKPRKGDVTVFPSFEPFYHGVLPMSGNKRYLIRAFLMYNYDGSDEWHNEKSMHEEQEWEMLEKQRRQDSYTRSDHIIRVVQDGDPVDRTHYRTVFTKNKPVLVV